MDKKATTKIIIIAALCNFVAVCGTGCQTDKKYINALPSATETRADTSKPSSTRVKTEEPTTWARAEPEERTISDNKQGNASSSWTEYVYVKKIYANRKYYDSVEEMHSDGWYGEYEIRDVLDHAIEHPANTKRNK